MVADVPDELGRTCPMSGSNHAQLGASGFGEAHEFGALVGRIRAILGETLRHHEVGHPLDTLAGDAEATRDLGHRRRLEGGGAEDAPPRTSTRASWACR